MLRTIHGTLHNEKANNTNCCNTYNSLFMQYKAVRNENNKYGLEPTEQNLCGSK